MIKREVGVLENLYACLHAAASAKEECKNLLIEPAGTLNTGDTGGNLTVTESEWI